MKNQDVQNNSKAIEVEAKQAYYEKVEPIRFKLKKIKIVGIDEALKRIYKVTN